MTSPSALPEMTPQDRAAFGYARARNAAYEALQALWRRRKSEGLTQQELGERIGMDPARVCKYLRGPGNLTIETFGAIVEGLRGEAEIAAHALEDGPPHRANYHAYVGYELPDQIRLTTSSTSAKLMAQPVPDRATSESPHKLVLVEG